MCGPVPWRSYPVMSKVLGCPGSRWAFVVDRHAKCDHDPGAASGFAVDGDLALHQIDQSPDDRHSQPAATEPPRGACFGLFEGVENPRDLRLRHADPGVAYLEHKSIWLIGADFQANRSAFRELDGVAHKVVQDLNNAGFIANSVVGAI